VLTTLPPGVVSAAGIALGNHPERSSSATLTPVIVPPAPGSVIPSVTPMVQSAPAFAGSVDEELE
jgi:hypothetical protein